jgi:hypothetical protein
VIAFDHLAFSRAWLAYFRNAYAPNPLTVSDYLKSATAVVAPWLITATIQIVTIRRRSLLMDCVRMLSFAAACLSISWALPESQLWWRAGYGPFGDGLPKGDFDGGMDVSLSYPVCLVALVAYFAERYFRRNSAGLLKNF